MNSYRRLAVPPPVRHAFRPARLAFRNAARGLFPHGKRLDFTDPSVEIVIPNMGRYGTEALSAVLRGRGFKTRALPIARKEELLEGRKHATCKECLPYLVTTGSFMHYLKNRTNQRTMVL